MKKNSKKKPYMTLQEFNQRVHERAEELRFEAYAEAGTFDDVIEQEARELAYFRLTGCW